LVSCSANNQNVLLQLSCWNFKPTNLHIFRYFLDVDSIYGRIHSNSLEHMKLQNPQVVPFRRKLGLT